jgi:hypothetical protein
MALPSSGAISTTQIMTELAIAIQPREWSALWALAKAGSVPKNKANAGGPYVLPNDWWGYSNSPIAITHEFSSTGNTNPSTACTLNADDMFLYSLDAVLNINSKIYTDIGLTILFNGLNRNWHSGGLPGKVYNINTLGVITAVANCT